MSSVLVLADDAALRDEVARLLAREHHALTVAAGRDEALQAARSLQPEIVIAEGSAGQALLDALRADPALATTMVLLLTAPAEPATLGRGMQAGADGYLARPFTREELLDALQALLDKRGRLEASIGSAVRQREDELRRAFSDSLGGQDRPDLPLHAPGGTVRSQELDATVLFSDIRGFTSMAEKLDSGEVAQLLKQYFDQVSVPVLRRGGLHLKFMGDGLMAVFTEEGGARRAVSAGLELAVAAHAFRGWLEQHLAARGLPPFAIGVGLHAGPVAICELGTGPARETTAIGDTVNTASRLQGASKELGWTVVASAAVLERAGAGVQTGGRTSVEVRGREGWLDVGEVVGLAAGADDPSGELGATPEDVREAVDINSRITARAVKGALHHKLSALRGHRFDADAAPLRLKGFRLLRKLGSGSASEVFLAEREGDGQPVVLKVLHLATSSAGLARFIQEYALLSRIHDPHVIRIYDQGFSDDHAYIAMEYFERGDLRGELRTGMAAGRVLTVVRQLASALHAVHAGGIVHRDLKPENVLLRGDGSVALGDFGVAKALQPEAALALAQARHGQMVGTPFYLSPEQARGEGVTPASDLYSLGVMFHEMLTGARPFTGDTLDLLLERHRSAPPPPLPPQLAAVQPLVHRLLAKSPQERYPSAAALLEALAHPELLRTFPA